jgi:hypothetical protein
MTGKEYQEVILIFLVVVAPLPIHYAQHHEAIWAPADLMLLARYQSHSDCTIRIMEKSLSNLTS